MSKVGSFSVSTEPADTGQPSWDRFLQGWQAEIGERFALPHFTPETADAFAGRVRAGRILDTAMVDLQAVSPTRTTGVSGETDLVRLYVVERGTWTLDDPLGRGEHALNTGDFLLHHVRAQSHFRSQPFTAARILMFRDSTLGPLVKQGARFGNGGSPELRLLVAHAHLIQHSLRDLSAAGALAAHAALIELIKGVATRQLDAAEPAFSPALVHQGRRLADRRLTGAGVKPADIARELHVSLRTLQRAFAGSGEPLADYIRRRRLEQARLDLATGPAALSVTEVAARYHFADSTHFIRAFKRRFGMTPAAFVRSQRRP
ncbi:helix-turn-helix transcriptional regulator [Catenuloplanes japonicus]|uniref:helix-turn-helix transcriptional regulator n=1 Tax=Catenuloplanes japonicus TaxID=33876 RepID=UPI0005261BE7|nr:helix-turn-helix transcriptional regulator [Catenuloplanes japonicus]